MRKRFALLVGEPDETLQNIFLKGFIKRSKELNYDTCIFAMNERYQTSPGREKGDSSVFSLVRYEDYDAIIVMADGIRTPGVRDSIEEELHKTYKGAVLFVDWQSKNFPYVMSDNFTPAKRIVEHLIVEHGFKDIAYLTGQEYHPHAKARLEGYKAAMAEHGLEIKENRIFYGDFWLNSGQATASKLIQDREHLPEAIACGNDYMAIGLIEELLKEGIKIPEDVAVVGLDAREEARNFRIPITTIQLPMRQMGEYCADYVDALCHGQEIPKFNPDDLVFVGESCGCPQIKRSLGWVDEYSPQELKLDFECEISEMQDDLLNQTEASGVISTVFSYVHNLEPFDSFFVCLNEEWSKDLFDKESGKGYADKMLEAIRCGETFADSTSTTELFERTRLLPALEEETEKARTFYFSPLYFEDKIHGYVAADFGEHSWCYGESYIRWLSAVVRGLEGYRRTAFMLSEIARLEQSQVRDEVTGLYNYKGFVSHTVSLFDEFDNKTAYANLAVLDLYGLSEHFVNKKERNSQKVLNDFAAILMAHHSGGLCYLGGSEFLLCELFDDEMEGELNKVTEDISEKLNEYCHNNGYNGLIKVVAGFAQGTAGDRETLEDLILNTIGEKNVSLRKEKIKEEAGLNKEDNRILSIVENILDNNLLTYHFQPIVITGSGEIYAYEALMRADVEERISPLDILKCATHLNRLNDVERATFFNVISFVENHSDQFNGKKVFINSIPGTTLTDEENDELKERLKNLNGKIIVELTEQSELSDEELEALKARYRDIGVETAVDDYGTGYSNVFNLLRYMPNVVKIDRMLLAGIHVSPQKQHFFKEITEFSHNNNIKVLAEGVETTEELKMVTMLGADLIQGFYTAKPNAVVAQEIDIAVMNEMVQYGQYALGKDRRKVYRAGHEPIVNLVKLVTGHYSKIVFPTGDVNHRDITLAGLEGFKANMEIDILDGFDGTIILKDANLVGKYEHPTIRIGDNCDVVLVLEGSNVLEQGGILVPASSKLTFRGDGNISIQQITSDGYGIGNGADKSCGEIFFEQDGRIVVKGNTMRGVGIGAGLGGKIHINRGCYNIQLTGEEAVAMGSLTEDIVIKVTNCSFTMDMNVRKAVGIGSLEGKADIDISFASVVGILHGRTCVGIGSIEKDAKAYLHEGIASLSGGGDVYCGVGSCNGLSDVSSENFMIKVETNGN